MMNLDGTPFILKNAREKEFKPVIATGSGSATTTASVGGVIVFSRYSGRPVTTAATPFATNTTATTQDGSIFTPNVVSDNRWWTITYSGDDSVKATYNVSLDITGLTGVTDQTKLYIVKRAAQNASWVALSTTLSSNILTATGLQGFSDFGIASDSLVNILPVQLASFTGTAVHPTSVRLDWRTVSETHNYGFNVERRTGTEGTFVEVPNSFIRGSGTTVEPHNYTFTDNTVPGSGAYQYRLRQQDLDGTRHFSEPINVATGVTDVAEVAPREFALKQNYPNPFNPETVIKFSVENTGKATLTVYNLLGQSVATLFSDVAEAGQYYKVRLNAANFASGMYIYRLQSGTRVDVKKMLLLK
jgi:hypothetical protein